MQYQLIVKIPFEALDDAAARQEALVLQDATKVQIPHEGAEYKLQRVYKDKAPEGVKL
jgi:hypothetical protein